MCIGKFFIGIALCGVFSLSNAVMAESRPIGFDSVEQVFTALQADPNAVLTEYQGWRIFNKKEGSSYVLWSFTPPSHFADPSVVRRSIVNNNGVIQISMDALCQREKLRCDALLEHFQMINENIIQTMEPDS